jgi:hypothetical protein
MNSGGSGSFSPRRACGYCMHTSFRATYPTLILRSRALARRLEGWPRAPSAAILRDAAQERAPQDEGGVGLAKTAGRCVNRTATSGAREKCISAGGLDPPFTVTPLAPSRIDLAPRLRGLLYHRISGSLARRTFQFSRLRGQLRHSISLNASPPRPYRPADRLSTHEPGAYQSAVVAGLARSHPDRAASRRARRRKRRFRQAIRRTNPPSRAGS